MPGTTASLRFFRHSERFVLMDKRDRDGLTGCTSPPNAVHGIDLGQGTGREPAEAVWGIAFGYHPNAQPKRITIFK